MSHMDPLGESTLKLKSHLTTRRQLKAPRPQNTCRSVFHSGFLLSSQCSLCLFQELLWPTHWINVLTTPMPECQEAGAVWNSFPSSHGQRVKTSAFLIFFPREVSPFLRSILHWSPLFTDMYLQLSCSLLSLSFSWSPTGEISLCLYP